MAVTPPVALVPVPAEEYDEFFAMLATYHAELDTYDPHAEDWDAEVHRRAVLDDMEGREVSWVLADGERAGLLMVRVLPDWPDESREVASIAEFYVAPPFRRRGVGREAIVALLADHRARGTFEVEAGILALNEPARAFWASLGFEVRNIVTARRP
ncbi:MAG: GNAT family N-acetyltransferase [Dehalococcoidia bacterium]|nr:GNAT family N-acetyltransferase [Dehalococcoidia bacterium]